MKEENEKQVRYLIKELILAYPKSSIRSKFNQGSIIVDSYYMPRVKSNENFMRYEKFSTFIFDICGQTKVLRYANRIVNYVLSLVKDVTSEEVTKCICEEFHNIYGNNFKLVGIETLNDEEMAQVQERNCRKIKNEENKRLKKKELEEFEIPEDEWENGYSLDND